MYHRSIIAIPINTQLISMNLPLLHYGLSPKTGRLCQEEAGSQCSLGLSPGTPAAESLPVIEPFPQSTETLLPLRHSLEDLDQTKRNL